MPHAFGRTAFDPSRPRLDLGPRLSIEAIVNAPAAADWLSRVKAWGMLANDSLGDCVIAEGLHEIEARTTYASTPFVATTAEAIATYSAVTGYNPADPSTDQGTNMADFMAYWRKTGVAGHKIVAYASVDIKSFTEIEAAVALFGAVACGISFPKSAMAQFDAGQTWDVVPNDGGIEGGHAIHLGAYDSKTGLYEVVTWGAVQKVTRKFLAKYLEEAWVVITQDWIEANGSSPAGLDLYGLGQDFAALTGQPNPIVPPVTPPVPPAFPGVLVSAVQAAAADPQVVTWLKRAHIGIAAEVVTRLKAILAAPLK